MSLLLERTLWFCCTSRFSVPAPSSMALRALSAMLFWITTVSSSSSTAIPSPLNAKQLSTVAAVLRFSSEKAFLLMRTWPSLFWLLSIPR
jgi:hypothetical protein